MDVKPEILPELEGMRRNQWQLTTITTRLCTQQRTLREYRLRTSVVVVSYFRFSFVVLRLIHTKGLRLRFSLIFADQFLKRQTSNIKNDFYGDK